MAAPVVADDGLVVGGVEDGFPTTTRRTVVVRHLVIVVVAVAVGCRQWFLFTLYLNWYTQGEDGKPQNVIDDHRCFRIQ